MKIVMLDSYISDTSGEAKDEITCFDLEQWAYMPIGRDDTKHLYNTMKENDLRYIIEDCDVYLGLYHLFKHESTTDYFYLTLSAIYADILNDKYNICYDCYKRSCDMSVYHEMLMEAGVYEDTVDA